MYFVDRARHHGAAARGRGGGAVLEAVRKAAADCRAAGLLKDFWEGLTMEDLRMIGEEWDWGRAVAVSREEGWEKGREEDVRNLLDFGMDAGDVSRALKLPLETVLQYRQP